MPVPYLPTQAAINSGGPVENIWLQYFLQELGQLTALTAIVNAVPGVNNFTVATQPALGPSDAGYLLWLTDYKHLLRWTGATWEFFGDSSNGFIGDFVIPPQTGLWQLCDGTVTKYLTLGATLTETSFTTPNLTGTPAYKKAAAAYTGAINAKSGSTGTGTTGTGTTGTDVTGTGTTGNESAHTHGPGTFNAASINLTGGQATAGVTAGFTASSTTISSVITGTSGAGSAHNHSVPSLTVPGLTVPGLTVPALAVGSIEMANIGMLPYLRR